MRIEERKKKKKKKKKESVLLLSQIGTTIERLFIREESQLQKEYFSDTLILIWTTAAKFNLNEQN